MLVNINNLSINYQCSGTGKDLILLHGWGGCIESWYPIIKILEQKYKIWAIDLPGFGKSSMPSSAFDLFSYSRIVSEFINHFKIISPVLVGHSFGGAVGAKLASLNHNQISKLILVDASGIRNNNLFKYFFSLMIEFTKNFRNIFFLKYFYSFLRNTVNNTIFINSDYQNSGLLKETFKKIISDDLTLHLRKILIPVFLIWGEKDKITPLWQAKVFKKEIAKSELKIIANSSHFAYLEQPKLFCQEIENFIEK